MDDGQCWDDHQRVVIIRGTDYAATLRAVCLAAGAAVGRAERSRSPIGRAEPATEQPLGRPAGPAPGAPRRRARRPPAHRLAERGSQHRRDVVAPARPQSRVLLLLEQRGAVPGSGTFPPRGYGGAAW